MWDVGKRHGRAVKEIPGFEQWRVKGSPVEAHEQIGICHALRNRREQRTLRSVARQKVLPCSERSTDEPAAPDEKRKRAGPTGKPRRLQVEKQRRHPWCAAIHAPPGKDTRMRVVPACDIGAISDSPFPVQRFRRVHAIHEYAGTAFELPFFSAKRLRNSLVRTRPGRSDSLTAHRWLAQAANQIT